MEQTGNTPLVSICSQIHNQTDWAKEMIASVVAQTYGNWELLIVDDGSTQDLKSVIESFNDKRITYFRFDEKRGIPKGTNYALKQAKGQYVCLMAADEVYWQDKLKVQVAFLEDNPKFDACWGLPGSGTHGNFPLGPRPDWERHTMRAHNRSRESWLRTLLELDNVPIGGLGLMMKKSVMDELGGMDESLTLFSDHELYCRFFEKYTGAILPYRVGIDKPVTDESVRAKNQATAKAEYEYVKAKHPLTPPPADGKVTVCIPCYNHAKFLPDAVASVLAQTRPVDEILILNDCSTDDFKTVAMQFTDPRVKLMAFDENRGVQEAMNQMALRATGDFIVFLSADDTLDTTYVEKALAEFKAHPWTEMVASQTDFFKEDMKTPAEKTHPFWSIPQAVNKSREQWVADFEGGNHYFGAGMYRTSAVLEVGCWEKEYKVISDYQMYLKLIQRENFRIIEQPLTHTRVHGANNSLLDPKRAAELPWLYHAAKKPFYRQRMRVVIATPFYELKGFSPYITSLTQTCRLLTHLGIDWRYMELSGDSYVHRARNTMVDMFLRDPDATHLFFVDSDMSWDPEAFVKMCLLPDDVVGAAYPVKNNWEAWTSIPHLDVEPNGVTNIQGRPLEDGSALIKASVLAGGFVRISRRVFETFKQKFPELWYHEPTTDKENPEHKFTAFYGAESIEHKFYGEDHCFAKRLRDLGIPMWIYPNVNIVHWGYKDFGGNYDKWLKKNFNEDKSKVEKHLAGFNKEGQRLAM